MAGRGEEGRRGVPLYLAMLASPNPDMRLEALRAMERFASGDSLALHAERAMQDSSHRVAFQGLGMVARMSGLSSVMRERLVAGMHALWSVEDPPLQALSIFLLGQIFPESAMVLRPELERIRWEDPDSEVRSAAQNALSNLDRGRGLGPERQSPGLR
jgi:HEAT repeat protein